MEFEKEVNSLASGIKNPKSVKILDDMPMVVWQNLKENIKDYLI
jgi:hypothetical protein